MSVNAEWLSHCINEIDQSGFIAVPDFLSSLQLSTLQTQLDKLLGRHKAEIILKD